MILKRIIEVGFDGKHYTHRLIAEGRSTSIYPPVIFPNVDNALEDAERAAEELDGHVRLCDELRERLAAQQRTHQEYLP